MQLAHPVLRSGFVPAASAVALLTGVTYVVVWFSLWFLRDGQGSSPWWWPATGVALAVLLHAPRRWWFPMIIGYGVANGLASRGADDVATTLVYLFVNVIELSVAAAVLGGNELRHSARGVTGRPVRRADNVAGGGLTSEGRSSTPRRAIRFAVATVLAIGLGAATIAVTGLMGIGHAASYGIVDGYVVTHALGMVTLGPLMMPTARVGRTTAAHRAETAAVIAAAIGIGLWAFFDSDAVGRAFLTLLPVIWAAIRLDAAWTSLISLGTCLFAVYSATRNLGTFAEIAGRGVQHGNVQLFVLTVGTVALALVLITRHRAQLAELVRDSENTLRIAVQDALVGMYSIRFDPGYIGEIRDANTAFSVMLGYRPAELNGVSSRLIGLGPGYRERLPPVEIAAFDTWMESFARGEPESFRRETQFYAKDGVRLWAEVSATRVTPVGQPPFALVHVHDLTSRFEHQTRLERMALHDALTGLANRVLLFRRITTALDTARGQDGNRSVGLLYADLDDFKAINDTHGHAAGDAALIEVARRLTVAVRPNDTVARLGGDEFAVLCEPIAHSRELEGVADRIHGALLEPIALPSGVTVTIRASIGSAVAEVSSTADSLMRAADAAMYSGKHAERSGGRPDLAVSTEE